MKEEYRGMTVNERLYVSGLLNKFDKAVRKKDIEKVISILREIDVPDLSIKDILNTLNLSDL